MPVQVNSHYDDSLDHMIFGPIDLDDHPLPQPQFNWESTTAYDIDPDVKPNHYFSNYEYGHYEDSTYDLATWIVDPDLGSPSSPIPIPSPSDTTSSSFYQQSFDPAAFSPASFAALHPLPRSISPPSSFEDARSMRPRVHSVVSPRDITPSWAAQLWDNTSAPLRTQMRPSIRHSPLTDATTLRQQRIPIRRASLSSGQLFHSSSAPTAHTEPTIMTRNYSSSRRADSVTSIDGTDRDATVRRKKRSSPADDHLDARQQSPVPLSPTSASAANPLKSVLRPPKLAPSAWQLYFTDWIQKQQASGTRKLNVAQAAKEAGQEYACLSTAEKEPYKHRSQSMKSLREKEHEAYMRTLTPEDIKRENLFRAAQRKAGKSRKSNIKDPNAPKKPLSAYFMFLQRIRADKGLVREIFGEETETTKQSVLAAAKWRSMTDGERQPFLAQAEQEKMEYEAARRVYEEGGHNSNSHNNNNFTSGSSSINFSISTPFSSMGSNSTHFPSMGSGSAHFPSMGNVHFPVSSSFSDSIGKDTHVKMEVSSNSEMESSESEVEGGGGFGMGFMADGMDGRRRS